MTIYVVPSGFGGLKGKIFESHPPISPTAALGGEFLDFFREKKIEVRTIDAWNYVVHQPDDAVVFIEHPEVSLLWRVFYFLKYGIKGKKQFAVTGKEFILISKLFSKKILFQKEPPTNSPYPYRHLGRLLNFYDKIFLFHKMKNSPSRVEYYLWPPEFREEFTNFHAVPKKKFLVMLNNNVRPHSFFGPELYSERLQAIKHFSNTKDFDLYGGYWDKKPFFPFWGYRSAALKAWRGYANDDKIKILSSYKFSLVFENSRYPGYVSEKIFDCLLAGCIPIYLGAPDITEYVPADCFIDMREFKNYTILEKYLRSMSDDEQEAYRMRAKEYIINQKDRIFSKRRLAQLIWNEICDVL